MARLEPNTHEDVMFILKYLRDADKQEMIAALGGEMFSTLPAMVGAARPNVWTAFCADNEPTAVIGWCNGRPGVASVFAFGTPRWGEVVLSLTRFSLRHIRPALLERNIHRIECIALKGRDDVKKWMHVFDAQEECTLSQWGTNKEDFVIYRWVNDDL